MLPVESPFKVNEPTCLYFWQLPVTKRYNLPKYYIGQVVLHIIKQENGEILHPVEIIGIVWTEEEWEYAVNLPKEHPEYQEEEDEVTWVNDWNLEAM